MAKAVWKGSLSFGLVNIPIKIYSAHKSTAGIDFHLMDEEGHRLEYKRWCPECEREIPWEEVEKGYEVEEGEYVTFEKEELRNVIETSKNLQIEKFIDFAEVDSLYFDKQYYLVPQEGAVKPFHLMRKALNSTNKAAVGRVTLRNKEYVVVIRAYQEGLLMTTLYYQNEIRKPKDFSELQREAEINKEEEKLAIKLIKRSTAELNIEEYENRYEEAVKSMIEQKLEGEEEVKPKVPQSQKTENIVKQLKASVEETEEEKAKA